MNEFKEKTICIKCKHLLEKEGEWELYYTCAIKTCHVNYVLGLLYETNRHLEGYNHDGACPDYIPLDLDERLDLLLAKGAERLEKELAENTRKTIIAVRSCGLGKFQKNAGDYRCLFYEIGFAWGVPTMTCVQIEPGWICDHVTYRNYICMEHTTYLFEFSRRMGPFWWRLECGKEIEVEFEFNEDNEVTSNAFLWDLFEEWQEENKK